MELRKGPQQKEVLIIDASPLFREFLKEKLSLENVHVETAAGKRDAFTKLINILPDLVIIDVEESFADLMDFLQKKYNDPNAKRIPIIISGPELEKSKLAMLVQFGIVKYFHKPIKFDIFFEAIGKILRANFSLDSTPCVLEIHHSGNVIFIEIAQGLNREKIALLKYKITEMIDSNNMQNPKVVLMMTNLSLSFVDGINVELLLDTVTSNDKIQKRNVKVLSLDEFVKDLIDGHPEYAGIKVIKNLADALNTIVDNTNQNSSAADVIADTLLSSDDEDRTGSVEMRFLSDSGQTAESAKNEGVLLKIAIVDDDEVIRKLLEQTFSSIGAESIIFETGEKFLQAIETEDFDLAVVDIFMPGLSGFDVLTKLINRSKPIPSIVYSQATQKEYVINALSLGAKGYLVKPQKPEVIIHKALEVLHDKLQ